MAVTRAGVGYKAQKFGGGSASGSVTADFNVAASAQDKFGVVLAGWIGEVDTSAATLAPTWNTVAMTPLCNALRFDSNKSMLRGWIIADPAAGAASVAAAFAGMPTGLAPKYLYVAAAALADVESDLDSIVASVVTAVGSGSVGSGGITVPSGVQADRVYSGHLVGKLRAIDEFSGTRVAAPRIAAAGQLLLGESRGATTVTPTASFSANTNQWAALGFNTEAMPLDALGFSSRVSVSPGNFGADLYRVAAPHPDREYTVPPIGAGDPRVIGGNYVRSSNGVLMPIWVKDPDDTLDFTLHWNHHLADDDEIVHVEHTTTGTLRVFSEAFDGAMTQVWLDGGTATITHPVRVRFTTRRGRRHDYTFYIAVGQN